MPTPTPTLPKASFLDFFYYCRQVALPTPTSTSIMIGVGVGVGGTSTGGRASFFFCNFFIVITDADADPQLNNAAAQVV